MNLNHLEAIALVQKFEYTLPDRFYDSVDVTLLPSFTNLRSIQVLVDADNLKITYGAQDISTHESGAYTGEVSGPMLSKLGCSYVVVGHSERRTLHNEDDATVLEKAKAVLANGMTPIVCIGEHLDVREAGKQVEYNLEQLRGSLAGLSAEEIDKVVIAYEPVWAIGTGRTATPQDAQEVCGAIRGELAKLASPEVADSVRILYGGSANAKNIGELLAETDVDGALVGGASLKAEDFAQMCATAGGS